MCADSLGDSPKGESRNSPPATPELGRSERREGQDDNLSIDASKPSATAPALSLVPVDGGGQNKPPASNVPSIDASKPSSSAPKIKIDPVDPETRRDYVRLIVTVGLLLMLFIVIVWSCMESASWPDHWNQTKEMLQTILPALIGLIGSVIGFYFGSASKGTADSNKSNSI